MPWPAGGRPERGPATEQKGSGRHPEEEPADVGEERDAAAGVGRHQVEASLPELEQRR